MHMYSATPPRYVLECLPEDHLAASPAFPLHDLIHTSTDPTLSHPGLPLQRPYQSAGRVALRQPKSSSRWILECPTLATFPALLFQELNGGWCAKSTHGRACSITCRVTLCPLLFVAAEAPILARSNTSQGNGGRWRGRHPATCPLLSIK